MSIAAEPIASIAPTLNTPFQASRRPPTGEDLGHVRERRKCRVRIAEAEIDNPNAKC